MGEMIVPARWVDELQGRGDASVSWVGVNHSACPWSDRGESLLPFELVASPGATLNDAVTCADVVTPILFYFIFYIFIYKFFIFQSSPFHEG